MQRKIILAVLIVSLVSAGCDLFGAPTAAGITKSVNGGADWQFSNAFSGDKNRNLSTLNISRLAFDPMNREILYAGSYSGGLYKSEDSGASWKNILSRVSVFDFAVSQTDPGTIYAAGIFAEQGKVLKTTDGGASWQQVYNEASPANPVRALALEQGSSRLVIGLASGNLARSNDSGLSWQLVVNFGDQVNQLFWRQDGIYVLLKNKGMMRGTETGGFSQLTSSMTQSSPQDYLYSGAISFNQSYVDPFGSGLMYVATTRGLFKSLDFGSSWQALSLPVKPEVANVRAVAVAGAGSSAVFASVGSTVYKSSDGGQNWQTQSIATSGFMNYILIDPQLPQIVYGGIYAATN